MSDYTKVEKETSNYTKIDKKSTEGGWFGTPWFWSWFGGILHLYRKVEKETSTYTKVDKE